MIAYSLLYGAILFKTDGFPYVIDNNESFSSLVHAHNLATYDFSKSFGLTDESVASTAAGHPYIHTHQGNFPRLFAFLIYILGAQSIESQIVITVFTVGLAAIWFAFRFFSKTAGPLFAVFACLVMMSNYVLFAQFQVNTYRIWHGFFFFSSLLWAQSLNHLSPRRAFLLGLLNFACLCYWEFVFAGFVVVISALYALALHHRRIKTLLVAWGSMALGGSIAAGTLLLQLTAYMGWENVLKDIGYTLHARNSAEDYEFSAKVTAFYNQHNVLFLQNYLDTTLLKPFSALVAGLFPNHLQYYGPGLVLFTMILAMGWLVTPSQILGRISPAPRFKKDLFYGWPRRLSITGKFLLLAGGLHGVVLVAFANLGALAPDAVAATRIGPATVSLNWKGHSGAGTRIEFKSDNNAFRLAGVLGPGETHFQFDGLSPIAGNHVRVQHSLGDTRSPWSEVIVSPTVGATAKAAYAFGIQSILAGSTLILVWILVTLWLGGFSRLSRVPWTRIFIGFASVEIAGWLAANLGALYDVELTGLLPRINSFTGLPALGLIVVSCVALSFAVLGGARILGSVQVRMLGGLRPLLLCGGAGYLLIYQVFTGYIYSGYLYRQAPFLVFITDAVVALAMVIAAVGAFRFARSGLKCVRDSWGFGGPAAAIRNNPRRLPKSSARAIRGLLCMIPFAAFALLSLGGATLWLRMQTFYVLQVPADNFRFLKLLGKAPFHGASFVANTYSAPFSASSGWNWAYWSSGAFSGGLTLTSKGFATETDDKYRWFADKDTNPAYLKPDYALTVLQPSNVKEALRLSSQLAGKESIERPAESNSLAVRAKDAQQYFLRHKLVASDGDRFSIVQMDWDFPPFLRTTKSKERGAYAQLTHEQSIALSAFAQQTRRRWRIELDPLGDHNGNSSGHAVVVAGLSAHNSSGRVIDEVGLKNSRSFDRVVGTSERSELDISRERSAPWNAMLVGDEIRLRLRQSPAGGRVRVRINDFVDTVDLYASAEKEIELRFSVAQPHGRFTVLPAFSPGQHVQTFIARTDDGASGIVDYPYIQQDGKPEENTLISAYRNDDGAWALHDQIAFLGRGGTPVHLNRFRESNPETVAEWRRVRALGDPRDFVQWLADHLTKNPGELTRKGVIVADTPFLADGTARRRSIPLPAGGSTRWQISVTPATRTKTGPEYFGLPFTLDNLPASTRSAPAPARFSFSKNDPALVEPPYGAVNMTVKFPTNRTGRLDPLVGTGAQGAGDFIYVSYHDSRHIRIGFDHWGEGGPLSPPIAIDYSKEHKLEISFGALFPPEDDMLYADQPEAEVEKLKKTVRVRLNGRTIFEQQLRSFESLPSQVTIGRNTIQASTCDPEFFGQIIRSERVWPEVQPSAKRP